MSRDNRVLFVVLQTVVLLIVPIAANATNCAVDTCLDLTMSDGLGHNLDLGLQSSPISLTDFLLGNFTISLQASGLPTLSYPDLLSLSNADIMTTGGTLTIKLTEVNIPIPLGTNLYNSSIAGMQTGGSSIDFLSCFDPANHNGTSYGCGAGTTTITHYHSTGTAFSNTGSGSATNSGLYSLTDIIVIDPQLSETTFNADMNVPEPATLSLLGVGFLAVGTRLRRKLIRG